ncbi:MAG: CapA family protein [Clostridia bacterium]|nr:CapA family protein [Clostridia bacterium]
MKRIGKLWTCIMILIAMLGVIACGEGTAQQAELPASDKPLATSEETPSEESVTMVEVQFVPTPTPEPTSTPEPTPTPTPTPEPTPIYVTIGAVGDIMIPSSISDCVRTKEKTYDFSTFFRPMREIFESVDLMCGNLEAPLAGEKSGYTDRSDPKSGVNSFNAPDSLIDTLKEYGFDVLTTANNHTFDRGIKGLYRTIEVIRGAGLYQTGTYLDEEDRMKPLIIDVNGVKIGIVAFTRLMNQANIDINRQDAYRAFGYYMCNGTELVQECRDSIARTRDAGAEFVILFAHWDYENDDPTSRETKTLARQAFEAGADCIIGAHPHRVKGAEYVRFSRADEEHTGLVLYSLGNFTDNSSVMTCMAGLFAKITLMKNVVSGQVTLIEADVLPTFAMRRPDGTKRQFIVVPAYEDPALITGLTIPLSDREFAAVQQARALVLTRLGQVEGIHVLEDPAATEPTE